MYDELLNFLLSRKRKLLSKEETDQLLQLIAKCMGVEEEYKEKTDGNVAVKELLDNVSFDDDLSYKIVIDDILCDDSDVSMEDFELMNMYKEDGEEPLHQRKFRRPKAFEKNSNSKGNKRKLGIKKSKNSEPVLENRKGNENNGLRMSSEWMNDGESDEKNSVMAGAKDTVNGEDDTAGPIDIISLSDVSKKTLDNAKDADSFSENGEQSTDALRINSTTKVQPMRPINNIDNAVNELEYKFDIGSLESVHSYGPEYKFVDEDGEEIK